MGTIAERKTTRRVMVGSVAIGAGAPVSIQSMTTTHPRDVEATVRQVAQLAAAGCDLVRVAAATADDTRALEEIVRQVSVPIIADVHYDYRRAIEAVEAGVHKIRLNPGNIRRRSHIEAVIDACKQAHVPVRVGVNAGSIVERADKTLRRQQLQADRVELMLQELSRYVKLFEDRSFYDLVLSAKSSSVLATIEVNRALSKRFDYPVHLGLTHAGPADTGAVRSAVAMGVLLAEGIGDTVRVSLAAEPQAEVQAAKEILYSLGLRQRREPQLIACPTCGRLEVDLVSLVGQVKQKLGEIDYPVKVAVMGCIVNGPGEADDADVALCAGRGRAAIYRRGELVRTVSAEHMLDALLEQVNEFIRSERS